MIASLCLAALALRLPAVAQDGAMFGRTYKAGEKVTYSVSMGDARGSLTGDLVFEVQKVLQDGRAEVVFHVDNLKDKSASGEGPKIVATGVTVTTAAHNLPAKYRWEQGTYNGLGFFVMVAGSTLDKRVRAGDQEVWTWAGENVTLKGTTKILSIDPGSKLLEARIQASGTYLRSIGFELDLKSTFSLTDGSLVEANGSWYQFNGDKTVALTIKRKG